MRVHEKRTFGMKKIKKMNMMDGQKDFLRNNPRFVNQYRSWQIMEKYFGITDPNISGSVFFSIEKWPVEIKNGIHGVVSNANKMWEQRAKLN